MILGATTMTMTTAKIINAASHRWPAAKIGERLQVNKGEGYIWLAYDDGAGIYVDHSVMVPHLSHLELHHWVGEVETLMDKVFDRMGAQGEVARQPGMSLIEAYRLVTSYIAANTDPDHPLHSEETEHLRDGEYEGRMMRALSLIEEEAPEDAPGLVNWFAKHAPGILSYDDKGNWIGAVANENGWTA
jgi:hypothetical protein